MRRAPAPAALVLAAALAGCGPKPPVAPVEPVPPGVVAVQPPARSAGYAYDGQIWALFDRPLDPASVDTTTVFLKKDTQRLACVVRYEPTSRRIVVVPRAALALQSTYTVVVTGLVRGGDGTPLGADYFWQFSTTSIRRPDYLDPAPGTVASPVAMLRWTSAGAVPGTLSFEVYAGPDSAAVGARTAPRLAVGTSAFYLPTRAWPEGARTYWAVTTTNLATGERLQSPVAGFDVIAAGAPTREVSGPLIEWGGVQSGRTTQYCTQSYVIAGQGYLAAARFDLDPGRMGTRVRSARLVMNATANAYLIPTLTASYCSPVWFPCGMVFPGPPYPDPNGVVATATVGQTSSEIVFESVRLAAWAEGMLRRGEFSGLTFTLTGSSSMQVNMSGPAGPRPAILLTVYD